MVATAGGVVIAVAPWVALAIAAVWLVTFAVTRYTSVASIVSAFALPLTAWGFGYPTEGGRVHGRRRSRGRLAPPREPPTAPGRHREPVPAAEPSSALLMTRPGLRRARRPGLSRPSDAARHGQRVHEDDPPRRRGRGHPLSSSSSTRPRRRSPRWSTSSASPLESRPAGTTPTSSRRTHSSSPRRRAFRLPARERRSRPTPTRWRRRSRRSPGLRCDSAAMGRPGPYPAAISSSLPSTRPRRSTTWAPSWRAPPSKLSAARSS